MEKISIIILGESGVGKTSIIYRIIKKDDIELAATIACSFSSLSKYYKKKNYNEIKYEFYDTGGAENFNSLTKSYIRGRDIVLLVFCNLDTLEVLINRWYEFIRDNADISKTKFIVVANKSDSFGEDYEVIKLRGKEFAREIDAFFITCSAKSKENIDNLEDHIEYEAIKIIEQREEQRKKDNCNQGNKKNNKSIVIDMKNLEANNDRKCVC